MYGSRSYKKSTSSRTGRGSRSYSSSSYGKMAKRTSYARKRTVSRPKFALTGYTRDTERKYYDKSMKTAQTMLSWDDSSKTGAQSSHTWITTRFPGGSGNATDVTAYVQDLVKGVPQGTNATSRIGNKINVKYLKGTITLSANWVNNEEETYTDAQYGESVIGISGGALRQYVRTTFRLVIVRDLQVNSVDKEISWSQVFAGLNGTSGVHAELNIANMGRFRVCMDKLISVDADDPQKTIRYQINNVGPIRYNGTETETGGPALTDNGYYVIWANITTGMYGKLGGVSASEVLVNNRMCFTDE